MVLGSAASFPSTDQDRSLFAAENDFRVVILDLSLNDDDIVLISQLISHLISKLMSQFRMAYRFTTTKISSKLSFIRWRLTTNEITRLPSPPPWS